MKALLVAINSKYIHPNLAVRLLAANTSYAVEILEFTIKDDSERIADCINSAAPDIVGISCYIWNIEKVKEILPLLHAGKILLGGPEVSYNPEDYIDSGLCDFVIKNEGERAFDMLLRHIDGRCRIDEVPNLYHKGGFTFDETVNPAEIKPAYDLYGDLTNKIAYIESSRGCPYRCGYCMAGIDNNLRFFDIEQIKKDILLLQSKGARVFKFLDRTFNANPRFTELIDFIIENHTPGESYQFEISGDILKPEIIDYINSRTPKGLIRFEIGIQSVNEAANIAVGRRQNNARLFENIIKIRDAGVIDMHLDLIAGLPYEDFLSFRKTFNECISLRAKELQLGFLKLLRGTPLYASREKYGYVFSEKAPYEIISDNFMSSEELKEIHYTEDAFDHYHNSGYFRRCINTVLDNEADPFEFFNGLGKTSTSRKLEDRFAAIDGYVSQKPYYPAFHDACILDYLYHFTIKPPVFWKERLEKAERMGVFRLFCEKYPDISYEDCLKYGFPVDTGNIKILAIYRPDGRIIRTLE